MDKKIKIDPDKIEYDGKGFKKVVKNEADFWNRLKDIQNEIGNDLNEVQSEIEEKDERAAKADLEI